MQEERDLYRQKVSEIEEFEEALSEEIRVLVISKLQIDDEIWNLST